MSGRPAGPPDPITVPRCRSRSCRVASSTSPLPNWLGPPVTELDRRVLAANPRMTVLLTGERGAGRPGEP